MSAKEQSDKLNGRYPWTARQRRRKDEGRQTRKQARKASRNKK